MIYDATKVAEILGVSKVTVYAKLKLPEIKGLVINQNGKACVDENGLEAIKSSLKYTPNADNEAAATCEIELLKDDMIETLKDNIEFLKEQLNVKDDQIYDIKRLLENTQVLFRQEQDKNKSILAIPEVIKEHDIQLVNRLNETLEKQRAKASEEESLKKKKGFFSKLLKK